MNMIYLVLYKIKTRREDFIDENDDDEAEQSLLSKYTYSIIAKWQAEHLENFSD